MSIGHNQFVEVYQGKRADYYAAVSSVSNRLHVWLPVYRIIFNCNLFPLTYS
jgi:hypothetical protein